MNTYDAIMARRSIRSFRSDVLPSDAIERILSAATRAPSGKNRQPWKFIVVRENKRAEMIDILRKTLVAWEERGDDTGSAKWTANVMETAQVTIFVLNPDGVDPWEPHTIDQQFQELVDVQSIGAAIQNMLLTAQELGIGSLWICDVLYASTELKEWLGEKGEMIAAISFGLSAESPTARPRKPMDEVVREL